MRAGDGTTWIIRWENLQFRSNGCPRKKELLSRHGSWQNLSWICSKTALRDNLQRILSWKTRIPPFCKLLFSCDVLQHFGCCCRLTFENGHIFHATFVDFKLLLKERKVAYNLRGTLKLNPPRVTTTTYGLHSFRYAATQVWNMLPDDIRTSQSLTAFKRAIQDITV